MDKDAIQNIAEQIADDMGYDYFDLSPKMQIKIYDMAMDEYSGNLADKADMMRENEESGGMMRDNYREGSPDDIPEQEDIPLEEFEDIKKMLNVPGDQASGIRSIDKRMVSAPDPMDERNSMMETLSEKYYNKPLKDLTPKEIEALEEAFDDLVSRKKKEAPSIKLAGGGLAYLMGM